MSVHPFAVSLNPDIQITTTEDHYTLHVAESSPTALLTLPTTPGIGMAFDSLKVGNTTPKSLVQALAELDGQAAGEHFGRILQKLDEQGWLSYTVLPLALAIPMVDSAKLNLTEPYWTQTSVTLSRFAYQRPYDGTMVLESPLSKFRVKLLDWRASAILAQLAQPQTLKTLTPPPYLGPETAYQFLNLLWAVGFLAADPEPPSLQLWDFHNLLFHSRSRNGRHDYPTVDIQSSIDQWSDFPVVKPPMSDQIVALPHPNLGALMCNDASLTKAMEARQSIQEFDEAHPIKIEQLSELLYRTARVKEIYRMEDKFGEDWKVELGFDSDFEFGDISSRPYPGGGEMYELEIYPVVRHCEGLAAGLYHYDPLNHQLEQIAASEEDIVALMDDAHYMSGGGDVPQVLLVITARFGRLFRKYRSLAYALVLKHVGVLYQNFYLVATNMGLAPYSQGVGDSDCFARATGLDYVEESSVGEFVLGSLPHRDVQASGVESVEVDISDDFTEVAVSVSELELDRGEGEPDLTDVGFRSSTQPTETLCASGEGSISDEALELDPLEASVDTTDTDAMVSVSEAETIALSVSSELKTEVSGAISVSEVESSTTQILVALHPHDLDDRLPGLAELHNQTLGDPRITIVILDGNPDHTLSCFEGAEVSKVFPDWHKIPDPIFPEDYAMYLEIDHSDLKGQAKQEALKAVLPELIISRIQGDCHACHITSVIVGQENTPVPGIAPKCRVINIPLNSMGKIDEEGISPLNMARAFELALHLGANIIHCAMCRPTKTGEGEELLTQALKKCQKNNILIVSPVGNNEGECWCLPAVLPGTLAVGAAKVDGTPCHFSNWGGNNTEEGILAPGENILGAQPCTEEPVRLKGTSTAAPIITGISALLMSLQLQEGKPVDAEAVRTALLNTAIPCDPKVVEEPERCLRGFVNIPGAMKVLFGQPSVTISFAGDQVTRTERNSTVAPASTTATDASPAQQLATPTETSVTAAAAPADASTIEASAAFSGNVYALGTLGYDFGDETRRDTFKQLMAPAQVNGIMVPADPYDARQMLEHLDRNPDESRSLIWTLSLDGDIIYALEPTGAFSPQIYEMFLLMLAGQLEPEASDEFVERISVPARRTNRTVELFSGQVVPVVKVHDVRGMYGWKVNTLVNAAMVAISRRVDAGQVPLVRQALTNFLNRVYNDLRNVGQTARDRALNFAATNIFQAATTFAQAIAQRRQLDTINVEKSPFCRINSDCWDVKLEFFDPESSSRGRKVFRFTLDVAQVMPVTLGEVKSWSLPSRSRESQQ